MMQTLRRRSASALILRICFSLTVATARIYADPAWWEQRGVKIPGAAASDFAPANVGQAKHLVTQAWNDMQDKLGLIGGAGFALTDAVPATPPGPGQSGYDAAAWQAFVDGNYAPLNIGQLKNLSYRFYDRLRAIGYTAVPFNANHPLGYPWTATTADDRDFAPVNLGQLKHVFSFDLSSAFLSSDANNNGLPDWWEHFYFPNQATVDPNAFAAGGAGLTIGECYSRGLNPNDFFNGRKPQLYLVGGGNQRGAAGAILPQPISILVNAGDQSAPLTFSVVGGALLTTDPGGISPSATLNVRSNQVIEVGGGYFYVAQVYVCLPDVPGAISTITATATTAGQSISASTTAIASDPNVQPPNGFGVAFNTSTYLSLSFSPSDSSAPVSIEVSQDEGITWSTWAVADPGSTSYTLTGLPQETPLLVRAFTGTDIGGNARPSQSSGSPPSTPPPPSSPTGGVNATLYLQPHIIGEQVDYIGRNWSYSAFQGTDRYLVAKKHINSTETSPPDDDGGDVTTTGTFDPRKGYADHTTVGQGGTEYETGKPYIIDSATSKHRDGVDDDGSNEKSHTDVNLSTIYPLATFRTDSESWWPGLPPLVGFAGTYTRDQNRAKHDFRGATFTFTQTDYQVDADYTYTHEHEIEKLRYRWQVNKDPNGHLGFDEVFLPKDGSAIKHHVLNWDTKGAVESPLNQPYTLDPLAINNKAEGIYRVLAVELQAKGQQDGAGIPGSIVPSIKQDGTGQKHFVVPRSPGGSVSITAKMAGQTEPGMDFDSLYEFVPMGSNATISSSSCQVKTDNVGQYTVQVRTKDGNNTIIASMNVWVVWATITSTDIPISAVDNGLRMLITGGFNFTHTIAPASICTLNADVPNLTGKNSSNPPGSTNSCGQSLAGGADKHWDSSRHIREKYFIPAGYPTNCLDTVASGYFANTDVGNDDAGTGDETNDPYANSATLQGQDTPTRVWTHATGADGDSVEHRLQFREFTRLEIAGKWYKISDLYPWRIHLKFKKVSGKWINDSTTKATDNANF